MKMMKGAVLGVLVATTTASYADFTYTETTQITGGSMLSMVKMAVAFSKQARQAGEPTVSTVSIKGNRMSRISPTSTEIIDLDAETITNIDTLKHQYTVVTFEQMKQQMEAAAEKAKEQQQKSSQPPPATAVGYGHQVRRACQKYWPVEGRRGPECERVYPYDEHGCDGQELRADGIVSYHKRHVVDPGDSRLR
jgi:hypothetical protein